MRSRQELGEEIHRALESLLVDIKGRKSAMGAGVVSKQKIDQLFGKPVKEFPGLGQLRRQKKSPHVEVFYIWVDVPNRPVMLRSINNCSNDQLTGAIRDTGNLLTGHSVTQTDAEFVLDLLYKEMGRRVGV